MNILLLTHSHTRWLVALVAAAAIVKFGWGWLKGGAYQKVDRILSAAFGGLIDLQAALGIIYLTWTSLLGVPFTPARLEHATTMLLAVVIAHLPARWKNAGDSLRFRNALLCIFGSLCLVLLGVIRLRGGWVW